MNHVAYDASLAAPLTNFFNKLIGGHAPLHGQRANKCYPKDHRLRRLFGLRPRAMARRSGPARRGRIRSAPTKHRLDHVEALLSFNGYEKNIGGEIFPDAPNYALIEPVPVAMDFGVQLEF